MVPEAQTLGHWAQELGGDQRTLARKLGGIKPARVEGRRKYYFLRDVVAAITADVEAKAKALTEGEGEGIDAWRKREQVARTRLLEADADERDGQLIDIDTIEWEWQGLVSALRARLLAVPHKLAPLVAAESDLGACNGLLAREIHAALAELATAGDDNGGAAEKPGLLPGKGKGSKGKPRAAAKANGKPVGRRKQNPEP